MEASAWIPVAVAAIAFAGAIIASLQRDRNNPMAQAVTAANSTTAQMQLFIAPLHDRVAELSGRIGVLETDNTRLSASVANLQDANRSLRFENAGLRGRVSALETQITELGHVPVAHITTVSTIESIESTTITDSQ